MMNSPIIVSKESPGPQQSEEERSLSVVTQVLEKTRMPKESRVLMAFLAGSHAFNLKTPTSDRDYLGVYAAPLSTVLSLRGPKEALESPHGPTVQVEAVVYEARKYAETLLKGNPKVIEPLFSARSSFRSAEFGFLVDRRRAFLTKTTLQQYVSFASQMLHEFKETGNRKRLYQAVRLTRESERIAAGNEPMIWLEGAARAEIMDIREGEHCDLAAVAQQTRTQLDAIDITAAESRLSSEDAAKAAANDWLLHVRITCPPGTPSPQQPTTSSSSSTSTTPSSHPLVAKVKEALPASYAEECKVIYCGASGSTAHHLTEGKPAGSEEDFVAVYAQPLRLAVTLDPCPEIVGVKEGSPETARGLVVYEVKGAASGIMAGNHRLLDALFARVDGEYTTPQWEALRARAAAMINPKWVAHYSGIAEGMARASESSVKANVGDADEAPRKLAHALRLVAEATRMMHGNPPVVQTPVELQPRLVMLMRTDPPLHELLKVINEVNAETTKTKAWAKTQPKAQTNPCEDIVAEWMATIRAGPITLPTSSK